MASRARLVAALLLGCAVAVVVPLLVWRSLPDRVAVHWDLRGAPEGFLHPAAAWATTGGATLVLALLTWLAHRATQRHPLLAAGASLGLFLTTVFAALTGVVMVVNAGATRPPHLSPLVVLPILVAGVGVVLAVDPRLAARGGRFRLTAARGGDAIWRGTAESGFAFPTTAAFVVAGVAVGAAVDLVGGLLLVAAGLIVLSMVGIEVEVTPGVVRVRYFGGLRWPATEIPVAVIEQVESIEVEPKRHGGWGYRGSLRLLGRAALNLRRGPGMRLTLTRGRVFLVTVDDAHQGVIAIRNLLARQSPERPAT